MFSIARSLIEEARAILWPRQHLVWVIGGGGSGKTTVCRAIAERRGIPVYDMDEAVFGRFRFDPARHPATTAWFTANNPLGWMLGLPWAEFDALYRAANAEMLDLLAGDLAGQPDAPLLIDGGITHPSLLAVVMPVARIACVEATNEAHVRAWETADHRAAMKAEVLALPDGAAMWRRFLEYNGRMTATIGRESRACGIVVLTREEGDVAALAEQVETLFPS